MNLLARFLPEIFRTKKIFGSLPCIVAAVLAAPVAVGLFANGAHAATWYLQGAGGNVGLTANTTQWNSALNGTGSNPAALPSAGNTDTWIVPPKVTRGVRATAAGNVWLGGWLRWQIATAKATGDLLVTVQVAVPAELTDEQREALESLAATLPSAPREHLGVA